MENEYFTYINSIRQNRPLNVLFVDFVTMSLLLINLVIVTVNLVERIGESKNEYFCPLSCRY